MKPLAFILLLAVATPLGAQNPTLPPPPQDKGLPYTRTSLTRALAALGKGVSVFPGSRYGYVNGLRVRLSEHDLLRAEALLRDGTLYVPASFIRAFQLDKLTPPPVPSDLAAIADRWVYAVDEIVPAGPAVRSPAVDIGGEPYVPFEEAARASGLTVTRHPSGLVHAGREAWSLPANQPEILASVVTLFDTPERFADPSIATQNIPILQRQGAWTDHVKVTPAQLAALSGPETIWPETPTSDYNEAGINRQLLGSKVPPPGEYPRLLFSEADIPKLAARVKKTEIGQKSLIEMEHLFRQSWWDPSTSDGQIFQKLSTGNLEGLEWELAPGKAFFESSHTFKGQKPGIHHSHIAYVPECLTAMAMYAILTNDEPLGKNVASAVANYYKLREPLLDRWLEISDSEFGSSIIRPDGSLTPGNAAGARTHWRNVHGLVAHMNLGLSLDLAGKWMTSEQKDLMRRVIAKATYGRRSHGQDGPIRFRDVNWMAWDLTHFLAVAAIEGLPGFDPEAYAAGHESVRAFCEWGVDPAGVIFESNGKNPGAFQFQLLSMVVVARRAENLFAHPHWKALLEGQVQMTSPSGRVIPNSGTQYVPHSRQRISLNLATQLKGFYPQSRLPDYLVSAALQEPGAETDEAGRLLPRPGFDAGKYKKTVKTLKRLRLPSLTYPGFVRAVLYDADVVPTSRADLALPLDFNAPVHGVFSAYSDRTPEAAWINLMVRPNHYLGAGHHHADAGMFHFSALGVDWITESPFTQNYSGKLHNLVLVDGKSQPDPIVGPTGTLVNGYNASGRYLDPVLGQHASMASADLTYAYSWRWNTQPPEIWSPEMKALGWEMDPSPEIAKIFAGTARMKLRPWWTNYNASNYLATSRSPFNPMEYVFRTTGLVRGEHPFGFVIDDVRKDATKRLYQWTAMLNGGVWQAEVSGLPTNAIALAWSGNDTDLKAVETKPVIVPKAGDPLLVVYALGMTDRSAFAVETLEGPPTKKGEKQYYDRLSISHTADAAKFRVLLVPVRAGETLPNITYDPSVQTATVAWADQQDTLAFRNSESPRTLVEIRRTNPGPANSIQ